MIINHTASVEVDTLSVRELTRVIELISGVYSDTEFTVYPPFAQGGMVSINQAQNQIMTTSSRSNQKFTLTFRWEDEV